MNIIKKFITNNDCYKSNVANVDGRYTDFQNNGPKGIMLHSVGCPQPSASVFVNNYNKSGIEVAVNALCKQMVLATKLFHGIIELGMLVALQTIVI